MFPVLCGNLFQNFYNIVDSMIVGRFLGVDALAAVGSTTSLNFLVVGWITGMTSGFGILISQAYGAKDEKRLKHYVAMSTYLCIALAVVMTVGLLLANGWILTTMNTPEKIYADTWEYIAIIYAGLPATILYNMLAAIARSLGDSKTPLVFLVLSSVLNIGLDLLLVAVIPLGVAGAAYATVASQAVSGILCFIYVWKKYEIVRFGKQERKISLKSIRQLLSMGVPMGLQFSITAIGTIIVQSAINVFGADYIAGYAAAGKLQNMVNTIFIAFGATIATYVGQNRGAGRLDRVRQGVKDTQIMILIAAAAFFLIIHFLAGKLTLIFVDSSKTVVIDAANQYFKTVSWCYPFLGSIFLYRNALQGMGYGLVPMLGGVFELMARAGVVALVLHLGGGFVQTCLSDPAAWISALIPLIPYYFYKMRQYSLQESKKVL